MSQLNNKPKNKNDTDLNQNTTIKYQPRQNPLLYQMKKQSRNIGNTRQRSKASIIVAVLAIFVNHSIT